MCWGAGEGVSVSQKVHPIEVMLTMSTWVRMSTTARKPSISCLNAAFASPYCSEAPAPAAAPASVAGSTGTAVVEAAGPSRPRVTSGTLGKRE